ncbi:MAG TPA: prepilin peptidase [Xanthobacteraceae bacterium]|jgi:prepilin peptidase CpaA
MAAHIYLADVILVITAVVLFYVAVTDLKAYKIRNETILLLASLFVLYTLASGRWIEAAWSVGLAAVIFGVLVYFYSRGWMGGGDVKMLTVALLWTGVDCALVFAILLFVFASLHALAARLGWVGAQFAGDDNQRIAFAPSVAAALISVFILGCLQQSA